MPQLKCSFFTLITGEPEFAGRLLGRGDLLRDLRAGGGLQQGHPGQRVHVPPQAAQLVPQVHHRQHLAHQALPPEVAGRRGRRPLRRGADLQLLAGIL